MSDLETKGEELAIYALFDALCLDPQAEEFLEQRASLLFENNGKRLMKMLRRFLHIATISSVPPELLRLDPSLSIYIESKQRIPIIGFWPAIANFLYKHLQEIAELQSPIVGAVCEMWLTSLPRKYSDGSSLPFRRQFAEIALATARSLQIAQGQGHIIIGDGERPIYSAALAAAEDLPDEISSWALEMAQRRPLNTEVTNKISEARKREANERAERLKNDPEYRARQEELARMRSCGPAFISSSQKLPPWPMGPKKNVERDFQHVCLHTQALAPLMKACPGTGCCGNSF